MSFRLKLLLSMVLLVVGITAATLIITEGQVRRSYEQHFQQSFRFQVDSFLRQREARLEPVKERVAAAATSPRLFAAMENATQERADQRDIDDLYQNALDQLSEVMAPGATGVTNRATGLYFFLSPKGEILYPGSQVKLPFSLKGLPPIAKQVEAVGLSASRLNLTQMGYLAAETVTGTVTILEMVFTPIEDQVAHQKLGVLAVGLPLPAVVQDSPMSSALWLADRLYASSIPANLAPHLEQAVSAELSATANPQVSFMMSGLGSKYQVYCQALTKGPAFPAVYQICMYSLAEAETEKQVFTRKILVSGTLASLLALGLSWLISRSLSVPLQELVFGAAKIEHGNYETKVVVRSQDELGRLGRSFNAMTERIRASHAALEQRIAERTHELEERKRAEAALRKSEASLREAQRIARLGNWEWDVLTDCLRWSDEVYSIFGVIREDFGGNYQALLDRVHPADRERLELALKQSLARLEPLGVEHRIVLKDGVYRIVRQQAEVLKDENGKACGMVGTVQDITEQKRIEAEFLRAQRMDGIGAIAGGMAHDLNNALAPILMGIQLIRKRVSESEVQQMLSVMEINTHRGAEMVRQVLTFARGRDSERELLDIGRLMREMENILKQTMPRSISVLAMVPPDLWSVLGNSTQIHQALLNLCINARDAMPKGGKLTLAADNVELGEIDTKEIPDSRPGSFVMIMVSDTGTGIPPEVLPRIFDAFFTTKTPEKGTGLGLPTILRIVRNHGGFISVKSEVEMGASFDIYLPRAEPKPSTMEAEPVTPYPPERGHNELILFIDDDRSVREMVAPILTEHGYRVLTAANGAEALGIMSRNEKEIRLVLTDVDMPVMNGLELMETWRSRRPDLAIVLMSGTFDAETIPAPSGAAAFLRKPFRLEQLLSVIAQALTRNRND